MSFYGKYNLRVRVMVFTFNIVAVSCISGGNWRKPLTCRKSLINFIT